MIPVLVTVFLYVMVSSVALNSGNVARSQERKEAIKRHRIQGIGKEKYRKGENTIASEGSGAWEGTGTQP